MKHLPLFVGLALSLAANSHAGWDDWTSKAKELGSKASEMGKDAWDSTKEFSADAWDSTKEFSSEAWEATSTWGSEAWDKSSEWIDKGEEKLNEMLEPENPDEARQALNSMSGVALAKLFRTKPEAKALFDKSYGYAVFDSRKFSLLLHTNGGSGVAVNRHSGERIYMNMFGAGIAAGFGGKFYQQVMLFLTKESYDNFVADGWDKGWEGSGEAGAVIWDEAAEMDVKVIGNVATFVMSDKGLLLDANLTGSKYWRDGDLN